MQALPSTVPVVFVHSMLAGLVRAGPAPREWLTDAGIAPALLDHPSARVTAGQYASLLRVLMERSGDEALGFLSRPLRPGSLALLARTTLDAGTLEVAVRRLTRAFGLIQDDLRLEVLHEGSLCGVALSPTHPNAGHPVFLHELLVRVFWRLLAWLGGGRLPIQQFDFAFPRPAHASSYAQLFPGAVVFDQPRSVFWFESRRLQTPVRRDEVALRGFLADAHTQIIIPRRGAGSTSTRLRAHLVQQQPLWPSLESCAVALNMAVSTLQRRLAQEQSSFRSVKDGLRRDVAIARLNTSDVPLALLADALGFSDSAAFQRAFKGWTGVPPGSYRRHAR